jgi:hypothetical protein
MMPVLGVRQPYERDDSLSLPDWAAISSHSRALVARLLQWETALRPSALEAVRLLLRKPR